MLSFRQYLEEKLIMYNQGKRYGQIVFLAGGAGSGKGFAIKNFMEGEKFKIRDVDEWKKDKEIEKRLKSDYINIQKDLRKDIILLERVIAVQKESFESGLKVLEMIKNKEKFDYEKFIINLSNVWNSGTFFGTSSAYDASVSSGRLTYFGNDEIANEIGIIYGHFYSRMDLNGEQLDAFWYSADFGIKYFRYATVFLLFARKTKLIINRLKRRK